MPDLAQKVRANACQVTLLEVAAMTPGTIDGQVFQNIHALNGWQFFACFYTAGALAAAQTLDIQIRLNIGPQSALLWSTLHQFVTAEAPPRQEGYMASNGLAGGHINNGSWNAGESFYPCGDVFIRAVLSAGAGTPSFRVLLFGGVQG
jgi:hypothetical protein